MKGLLIKDFKLLKNQKNFFIILIAIATGMSAYMEDVSFIIGYLTFICSLFTLSSISYDEFDNGYAFLFSLPITRKGYVLEKYSFGLIIGIISWLFATTIAIITGLMKNSIILKDILIIALLELLVLVILLSVMLPFQLKFGGEKGRIAIICAVGIVFVIAFVVVKIAGFFNIDLIKIFNNLPVIRMDMLIAIITVITILLLMLSLKTSVYIINKKEF